MEKKEINITIENDINIKAEGFINTAEIIGTLNTVIYTLLSDTVDKYIEA